MSLGRPIHAHIPAKAKALTLAINRGWDLPTRNSAITLSTLEEGLLSPAHTSPVSSAYSAVANLSWDTPTFRVGLREQGLSLVFHPSQLLSGRLRGCSLHQAHFDWWGRSGFSGTLQSVGSSQWTAPKISLPVAQRKVALGPHSKAWLWTAEKMPAICGPRSLSLLMPLGLGFPLSHLRKESPSSDS